MFQPDRTGRNQNANPHETNEEVLNDRPSIGTMGVPHASGGARAIAFIRKGMSVVGANGRAIGTVDRVENGKVWLAGDLDRDGADREATAFVPVSLIDGVDDARVILSERGDASFGLGAES